MAKRHPQLDAAAEEAEASAVQSLTQPASAALAPPLVAGPANRTPPRFEIRTPNPGFTAKRAFAEKGKDVQFRDGVCETNSKAAATHCARLGYQVTDRESGKVVNPLVNP